MKRTYTLDVTVRVQSEEHNHFAHASLSHQYDSESSEAILSMVMHDIGRVRTASDAALFAAIEKTRRGE